jgi:hypothetical protein
MGHRLGPMKIVLRFRAALSEPCDGDKLHMAVAAGGFPRAGAQGRWPK